MWEDMTIQKYPRRLIRTEHTVILRSPIFGYFMDFPAANLRTVGI